MFGGVALALAAGHVWRLHPDIDIAVLPENEFLARRVLAGAPRDVDRPVELMLSAGDTDGWRYRRTPELLIPWEQALCRTHSGVVYLAPELVLLSSSRRMAPKDLEDATRVIPLLSSGARELLLRALPDPHPWRTTLAN